jgi:ABC-2 type transport system permease protein
MNAMSNSLNRIAAMTARYYYILRSSWLRPLEIIYWPTMQMLVWGFLYTYLYDSKSTMASTAGLLLGAVLLWDCSSAASSALPSHFWRKSGRATLRT